MEVAKVTMPAKGGKVKKGSDWDLEAKHDADRTLAAMQKRFPDIEFSVASSVPGTWVISAALSEKAAANELASGAPLQSLQGWLGDNLKSFAEGFLASASLWER